MTPISAARLARRSQTNCRRAFSAALGLTLLLGVAVLARDAYAAPAGVNIQATEGQPFTGTVVSGLVCPLLSATINWGDGSASSAGSDDGSGGIQGTHTYGEEGKYNGSVSYTYKSTLRSCPTGTQTASFHAAVQDALLSASGHGVSGIPGQSLSGVVAHFNDADPAGAVGDFSVQIQWGDGSTSAGSVTAAAGGFDVSGTHTYTTAGSFPISTQIIDIGGSSVGATATATVTAGISTFEGLSFSRKIAQADCQQSISSATISWGDGTSSQGTVDASNGILGNHAYGEEGAYNGAVSYTCPGAPDGTLPFQATVADAPLSAVGLNSNGLPAVEAGNAALFGPVVHFTDADPGATASDFSVAITWGDGTRSTETVGAAAGGGFTDGGTHVYQRPGRYTVTSTISDVGGSTATTSSTVVIADRPIARLTVTPNPTCTGVQTKLDASGSRGVGGLTFKFEYEQPQYEEDNFGYPRQTGNKTLTLISTGRIGVIRTVFDWDALLPDFSKNPIVYHGVRDPADVVLTVTDAQGVTAVAIVTLNFLQTDSRGSRIGCPPDASPPILVFPFSTKRTFPSLTVNSNTVSTSLPCRSKSTCFGSIELFSAAAGVAARRRAPQVLATAMFQIAPGKHKRVQARLTKLGRRLLRPGRAVRVRVAIAAISANGKVLTRTKSITLKRPRR